MIRLITLLLVPVLLALAIACDDSDDDTPAPTNTDTVMESPEPPTPGGSSGEGAQFSGSATIDGVPMPDNHPGIGAQVNGNNCGDTGSAGGISGGTYEIVVASAETGKEGCGSSGDTVFFVLLGEGDPGGIEADQTGIWDDSQANQLDLTFTTVAPPPPNGSSGEGAQFSGTVTIDGAALPDNHPGIGAQVNGNNCGDTGSTGGISDGTYEIVVASAEAGKEGCGAVGDTVVFVLLGEGDPGGTEADQTGTWDDSQVNELNLTFTTE